MVAGRKVELPPSVHIELFVIPRSQRPQLRRGSRRLYRAVRAPTRQSGGAGPYLYLVESRRRAGDRPQDLAKALGVRAHEDLWLELAFYPSPSARRRLLTNLWKRADVIRLARGVEAQIRTRHRAWTLANGVRQRV